MWYSLSNKQCKATLKLASTIPLVLLLNSCLNKELPCEAFNFSRIPNDSSFYYKSLYYSNGFDTLKLTTRIKHYAKRSTWGFHGFGCTPDFYTCNRDDNSLLDLSYNFTYSAEGGKDTSLYLELSLNSSNLRIKLDSLKGKLDKEVIFDRFQHYGGDRSRFVKKIAFQNMRITLIEKSLGEKLYLVKVGDSVVKWKQYE